MVNLIRPSSQPMSIRQDIPQQSNILFDTVAAQQSQSQSIAVQPTNRNVTLSRQNMLTGSAVNPPTTFREASNNINLLRQDQPVSQTPSNIFLERHKPSSTFVPPARSPVTDVNTIFRQQPITSYRIPQQTPSVNLARQESIVPQWARNPVPVTKTSDEFKPIEAEAESRLKAKDLQLRLDEYNNRVKNLRTLPPATSQYFAELKNVEKQKENLMAELDTRSDVLKTDNGFGRSVPASFDTIGTWSIEDPYGKDAIKVNFKPEVLGSQRIDYLIGKTSKPSIFPDVYKQAQESAEISKIYARGVADIDTEIKKVDGKDTIVIEPKIKAMLESSSVDLNTKVEDLTKAQDKYNADFQAFLTGKDYTTDETTGKTTILSQLTQDDETKLNQLSTTAEKLNSEYQTLAPEITNLDSLSKEYQEKQNRFTQYYEAKQKGLKAVSGEDKLKLYKESYQDQPLYTQVGKAIPLAVAEYGRGIVAFNVVNPGRVIDRDLEGKSTSEKIGYFVNPLTSPLNIMNQLGLKARGVYDYEAPVKGVDWSKQVDWSAGMGAIDTALIAGSAVRAATKPLMAKGAEQAAKSTVGKKVLTGLGIGILTVPAGIEGYKVATGQETGAQAAGNIAEIYTRLGMSMAGPMAAAKTVTNVRVKDFENMLTKNLNEQISRGSLQFDTSGTYTGKEVRPKLGGKEAALKDVDYTTYLNTNEGNVQIKMTGKQLREMADAQLVGAGKMDYQYRIVDASGNPYTEWSKVGKVISKESGLLTKKPDEFATPSEYTKQLRIVSGGRGDIGAIKKTDLYQLKDATWSVVETPSVGKKGSEYYLIAGKSRAAERSILPDGKENIQNVLMERGTAQFTKFQKISPQTYEKLKGGEFSTTELARILPEKDLTKFIKGYYGKPDIEMAKYATTQTAIQAPDKSFTGYSAMTPSSASTWKPFIYKASGKPSISIDNAGNAKMIFQDLATGQVKQGIPANVPVTLSVNKNTGMIEYLMPKKAFDPSSNAFLKMLMTKKGSMSMDVGAGRMFRARSSGSNVILEQPIRMETEAIAVPIDTSSNYAIESITASPGFGAGLGARSFGSGLTAADDVISSGLSKMNIPSLSSMSSPMSVMATIPRSASLAYGQNIAVSPMWLPTSTTLGMSQSESAVISKMDTGTIANFGTKQVSDLIYGYQPATQVTQMVGTETIQGLGYLTSPTYATENLVDTGTLTLPESLTTQITIPELVNVVTPVTTPALIPAAIPIGFGMAVPSLGGSGLNWPSYGGSGRGKYRGRSKKIKNPLADYRIYFQKQFGFMESSGEKFMDIYGKGIPGPDVIDVALGVKRAIQPGKYLGKYL